MMLIEYLGWPLAVMIFIILGLCFTMSMLFTFFLEGYKKIEERLNLSFFAVSVVNPLNSDITFIDGWAKQHHEGVGIVLISLSIFNLVSFIRILVPKGIL